MATEYVQNGNFSNDLDHWVTPGGFEPHFKPKGDEGGQSIKLDIGVAISQSIEELRAQSLHIEFDVLSADPRIDEVLFVVTVGGYNKEGAMNLSPVIGLATQQWKRVSGNILFGEQLERFFLNVSAASKASLPSFSDAIKASPYGPVRFANLSLTMIDAKDADKTD
ncbi:hypothetical protein ACTACG_22410 [Pseudomonas syringae]|uniref:Uncharacterized protein n=1 Tax=Pseudomonas viridiflava ICMP 13104 TaxID=1198305 RepID=A0A0W0IBW1_PSEVI|nr:hypothetical protein [Pseudomonas syringae]KTB70589.1 hypothetical protein AO067_06125 [Pseudomonas viridiflava ICMP 13104]KTB83202.1 hypothetical protein AO070_18195 [Pseudomonas syringae pv. syringae PD2766]